MKPSEILSVQLTEYSRDLALFDILDQMAKDIKQIKFFIKYICPEDVIKGYPFKEREWENEP